MTREEQMTSGPGLEWIVKHERFDYLVGLCIVLNAMLIGAKTDWVVRNLEQKTPSIFKVLELTFCVIFTVELAL